MRRDGRSSSAQPAFIHVTPSLLDTWAIGFAEAWSVGLANLRERVAARRYDVLEYGEVGGMPLWWYQSADGWASTLLLLQDELNRHYGDESRLLVAPMRDLLLAAPIDADRDLLAWLSDEMAQEDPNGLDLPILTFVDGRLAVDSRPPDETAAPNAALKARAA